MTFGFNIKLTENYHSNSQKSRVLTEDWVERNLYCPICGKPYINRYENNHPTGDFYCETCSSDFELKSKESNSDKLSKTIADGEYSTMISRITSLRNPLGPNARRAGWTGCNIDISSIPDSGKIFIVKNQLEIDHNIVISNYAKTKSLQTKNLDSRGWLLDTLSCIERIKEKDFTLNQVYNFEEELKLKHPDNNFIKDKIRQQLQYLRDKGFIEFVSPGHYRKI